MQYPIKSGITTSPNYKRTRLAPTPSGFLHLGNVLSFSLTAWLAQMNGASVLLRIDDLDRQRVRSQFLQDIFETLRFLEIPWNEGPCDVKEFETDFSQVHRMKLYQKALNILAEKKAIFACACSRLSLNNTGACACKKKQISLDAEGVSWRIDTGNAGIIDIKNIDGPAISTVLPPEMENFVVRKKDGSPSYQLTSVVDDLFYNVDLIVRGQDLWPSTIAQHLLADGLDEPGFAHITFVHHQLLTEASGGKMSKSAGATSVKFLREQGKSSTQIFEMIGQMLENKPAVTNWRQLGETVARGLV